MPITENCTIVHLFNKVHVRRLTYPYWRALNSLAIQHVYFGGFGLFYCYHQLSVLVDPFAGVDADRLTFSLSTKASRPDPCSGPNYIIRLLFQPKKKNILSVSVMDLKTTTSRKHVSKWPMCC